MVVLQSLTKTVDGNISVWERMKHSQEKLSVQEFNTKTAQESFLSYTIDKDKVKPTYNFINKICRYVSLYHGFALCFVSYFEDPLFEDVGFASISTCPSPNLAKSRGSLTSLQLEVYWLF